jgi:hypothetical protein
MRCGGAGIRYFIPMSDHGPSISGISRFKLIQVRNFACTCKPVHLSAHLNASPFASSLINLAEIRCLIQGCALIEESIPAGIGGPLIYATSTVPDSPEFLTDHHDASTHHDLQLQLKAKQEEIGNRSGRLLTGLFRPTNPNISINFHAESSGTWRKWHTKVDKIVSQDAWDLLLVFDNLAFNCGT